MKKVKGFSLVELLICLVLSCLILTGLINLVMHNKVNHQHQALELQLENNLSYAQHVLEGAIRQAGTLGCSNADRLGILNPLSGTLNTLDVSYAESSSLALQKDMADAQAMLNLKNDFTDKDSLIISDCKTADVFSNDHATGYAIAHPTFHKAYSAHAHIARWMRLHFFIEKTSRKDEAGQFVLALYQQNTGHDKQELVDHVISMEVTYAAGLNDLITQMALKHPVLPTDFKTITLIRVKLKAAMLFQNTQLTQEKVFFVTVRNRVVS